MSWAAVAKAATAPAAPTEAPAPTPEERVAVIDANAIISGIRLEQLADRFCTIPEVVNEVRDKQSRAFLSTLPFSLDVREPSDESMRAVQRFARETGDIHSLSAVDLQLLALAHSLEVAAHGTTRLREHPVQVRTRQKHKSRPRPIPGWGHVSNPEDWKVVDEAPEDQLTNATGGQSRIIAAVQSLTLDGPGITVQPPTAAAALQPGGSLPALPLPQQATQTFTAAAAAAAAADGPLPSLPLPSPSPQEGEAKLQQQQQQQQEGDPEGGEDDEEEEDEGDEGGWQTAAKSRNAARRRQRRERRRQTWLEQQQQQPQPQQGDVQAGAAGPSHAPSADRTAASAPSTSGSLSEQLPSSALQRAPGQPDSSLQEDRAAVSAIATAVAPPDSVDSGAAVGGDAAGPASREGGGEGGGEAGSGSEDEGEGAEGEEEFEGMELVTEAEEEEEEGSEGPTADGASEAGTTATGFTEATATATVAESEVLPNTTSNVFSVTADFAMQNVLLQMGLRLVSRDGKQITRVSRWALRCSACFFVTKEAGRLFCPRCGNLTLDKVEVTVGPGGAEFFGVRKKFVLRGTRFSLPKPKGGRGARSNPVLREDVFLARTGGLKKQGRGGKKANELDPFAPEFGSETWHQAAAAAGGRAGGRGGAPGVLITNWKNNPNEVKPQRKSRRK